jgi:predicted DNA-binding transcriptional regulator YafY
MNRTDRLLAIVLELQAKNKQRAEDLAATFETSKRTIYRDIQALAESGVPIVSIPGQGYSLVEGYFLPPLRFTTGEASMLLLGSHFIAQSLDEEFRSAALSASRKIEALLPEQLRREVADLQDSLRFIAVNSLADPEEAGKLQRLRLAILARKTVRFDYESRFSSRETRTVDPYRLTRVQETWYLVGYDHLRQELRTFRLERMQGLVLLPESFKRSPQLVDELQRVELESSRPDPQSSLEIKVFFDPEVARWVSESRFFFMTGVEDRPDGLLVTLHVRREEDAVQWLLSWGAHMRVLAPESLKARLASEAQAMLSHHQG